MSDRLLLSPSSSSSMSALLPTDESVNTMNRSSSFASKSQTNVSKEQQQIQVQQWKELMEEPFETLSNPKMVVNKLRTRINELQDKRMAHVAFQAKAINEKEKLLKKNGALKRANDHLKQALDAVQEENKELREKGAKLSAMVQHLETILSKNESKLPSSPSSFVHDHDDDDDDETSSPTTSFRSVSSVVHQEEPVPPVAHDEEGEAASATTSSIRPDSSVVGEEEPVPPVAHDEEEEAASATTATTSLVRLVSCDVREGSSSAARTTTVSNHRARPLVKHKKNKQDKKASDVHHSAASTSMAVKMEIEALEAFLTGVNDHIDDEQNTSNELQPTSNQSSNIECRRRRIQYSIKSNEEGNNNSTNAKRQRTTRTLTSLQGVIELAATSQQLSDDDVRHIRLPNLCLNVEEDENATVEQPNPSTDVVAGQKAFKKMFLLETTNELERMVLKLQPLYHALARVPGCEGQRTRLVEHLIHYIRFKKGGKFLQYNQRLH